MGFSAGGHLTARLAHDEAGAGHPPAFVVLVYPAYLEKGGTLTDDVMPIKVPTFLCVGDRDKTYFPSSVAFEAACRAQNIPCTYVVAPGAGHGFGIQDKLPAGAKDWPDKLKAFLATLPDR
jgi:acetyl esterase/lipase